MFLEHINGKSSVENLFHEVSMQLRILDRTVCLLSDVAVDTAGIHGGTPLFKQATALGVQSNGDIRKEFVFNRRFLADGSDTPAVREDRSHPVELNLEIPSFKMCIHNKPRMRGYEH